MVVFKTKTTQCSNNNSSLDSRKWYENQSSETFLKNCFSPMSYTNLKWVLMRFGIKPKVYCKMYKGHSKKATST